MPSFYPRTFPRSSPPTPPGYGETATCGSNSTMMQQSFDHQHGIPAVTQKNLFNFAGQYGQPSGFPGSNQMGFPTQPAHPTTYNSLPPPSMPRTSQAYAPYGAPLLPPIQVHDRSGYGGQAASQSHHTLEPSLKREPAKEEKPVGGVSAHLDYEMQQMSDFVSEMAQGMYDLYISKIHLADIDMLRSVQPSSPVSPAFRKFVSQILTSTRLPCSTILLGLYYLASRMKMLSANGTYKSSTGQVYRMLTIALLLGSKFLDDNTFQNRSWAEVTGLGVSELNTLEVEWLVAIEWNLHIDPLEHQGFMAWRGHWESFKAKAVPLPEALKLTPIDTSVQRRNSHRSAFTSGQSLPSPFARSDGYVNSERQQMNYQTPYRYDQPGWSSMPGNDRSPPSAPETGPNTPEYYGAGGNWGMHMASNAYSLQQHASFHQPSRNLASYQPFSSHDIWNPHGPGCGCGYCMRSQKPYFMAGMYRPQTVVG
ncbi:MAG: hypothetical protein M1817_003039 [Caeruleum heppii]|nr:MAG: hypothetical protein M1817_003039 [Caeruleum heppii]